MISRAMIPWSGACKQEQHEGHWSKQGRARAGLTRTGLRWGWLARSRALPETHSLFSGDEHVRKENLMRFRRQETEASPTDLGSKGVFESSCLVTVFEAELWSPVEVSPPARGSGFPGLFRLC